MTKAAALHKFFSSFGMPAFEENSVYELENEPDLPYLTYELITDAFSDTDTPLTLSLWDRTGLWNALNAKTEEISAALGRAGRLLTCDGGYILLMRRSPFAQRMGDDADNMMKRVIINISARFYTNH